MSSLTIEKVNSIILTLKKAKDILPSPEKVTKNEQAIFSSIRNLLNKLVIIDEFGIERKLIQTGVKNEEFYIRLITDKTHKYFLKWNISFERSRHKEDSLINKMNLAIYEYAYDINDEKILGELSNCLYELFGNILLYIHQRMKFNQFALDNTDVALTWYSDELYPKIASQLINVGLYKRYTQKGLFTMDKALVNEEKEKLRRQNILIEALKNRNGIVVQNFDYEELVRGKERLKNVFNFNYVEDGIKAIFNSKADTSSHFIEINGSEQMIDSEAYSSINEFNEWLTQVFKENQLSSILDNSKYKYYYNWIDKNLDDASYELVNAKLEKKTNMKFPELVAEVLRIKGNKSFEIFDEVTIDTDYSWFLKPVNIILKTIKFTIKENNLYLVCWIKDKNLNGEIFTEDEMFNQVHLPLIRQYKKEIFELI